MTIAIIADDNSCDVFAAQSPLVSFRRLIKPSEILDMKDADACICLDNSVDFLDRISIPTFVNSNVKTLDELRGNENVFRFNGWNGFFQNSLWEISGRMTAKAQNVLTALGKDHIIVQDGPGFISARILSMIINEAYMATGEAVGSSESIDIAMRLGTNYPNGPFEWASIIGLEQIYLLLKKLSINDNRYIPASLISQQFSY